MKEFILTGGRAIVPPQSPGASCVTGRKAPPELHSGPPLSLEQLRSLYIATLQVGAVETNTLALAEIHFRHLKRSLGADFPVGNLKHTDLQKHISKRALDKGRRGRKLSAVTIRKELAGFRAAWNWGVQAGLVEGPFPNKGLKFPKTTEKLPFQTRAEIERQIASGGLNASEQADLWDCLFLSKIEIDELLEFVKANARQPWIYPMVCFAAHTGVRRSEMIRAKIGDIDLDAAVARIHEKKHAAGKRTSRRVPLSDFLVRLLRQWLANHPGSPFLFAQNELVFRSSRKRGVALQITRDEAQDHFRRTMADSKWSVLKGWHVLRHSFISICVSRAIDQRVLRTWVGHTTAEMEARYTHLYPSAEKELLGSAFGG